MKYNGEFKCIDTPEKAYFLGQAFGDGYNCINPAKFSMASINTDSPIYEKLHDLFPFLSLKYYKSHPNMIYLENREKEFCKDLGRLGLISNKTTNDKTGLFHFPTLPNDLIHHFIRGYFDADGCAWYPSRYRSRNNLHIEFGCSTPNFLKALEEELKRNGINLTFIVRDKKAGNQKYYTSYTLLSSNRTASLNFANYIYKDSTIHLPYKYERCYRKPVDLPKSNAEIYGNCPYCNGKNLQKRSIRRNKNGDKQKLFCTDCNKMFSVPMPTYLVTSSE